MPRAEAVQTTTDSLRKRKKARTRAALIEVSQRLFAERGYHQTTLEEICDEVEVRPQTLLRYFESKAHLALAPWSDQLVVLRRILERPSRAETTVEFWRGFVRAEALEVLTPSSAFVGNMITNHTAFRGWADKDPFLVAMNADLERQCEAMLARGLAADLGVAEDDLHSTLLAAMLVVGRRAVYDRWCASAERSATLVEDQLAVVDYALASLPRRSARRLLRIAR
jgi:AcrR family transcriptional regulator